MNEIEECKTWENIRNKVKLFAIPGILLITISTISFVFLDNIAGTFAFGVFGGVMVGMQIPFSVMMDIKKEK